MSSGLLSVVLSANVILKTDIPAGIVYSIWSSFGIALVTLIGMAAFDDKISPLTGVGLVVVIVGVVLVQAGNSGSAVHWPVPSPGRQKGHIRGRVIAGR